MSEAIEIIKGSIRTIKDFPKDGILFRDVTTLLKDKEAFSLSIDLLVEKVKNFDVNYIAGVESRGFIFGAALAQRLNKGFITIRKKGKLPCDTYQVAYELEYGTDFLEIDKTSVKEGDSVLIVDDLLATGGTVCAAKKLIELCGATAKQAIFVIDLPDLKGGERLLENNLEYKSLISYEGH